MALAHRISRFLTALQHTAQCKSCTCITKLTWSAALREVSVCSAFALCRFIRSVFAVALFPPGAVGAQSQAACPFSGRCLQASLTLLQAPLSRNVHYAVPFLLNTTALMSVNEVIKAAVVHRLNVNAAQLNLRTATEPLPNLKPWTDRTTTRL